MELWLFAVEAPHGPSCGGTEAGLATLTRFRSFATSSLLSFLQIWQKQDSNDSRGACSSQVEPRVICITTIWITRWSLTAQLKKEGLRLGCEV
jgi:hypothetical protein